MEHGIVAAWNRAGDFAVSTTCSCCSKRAGGPVVERWLVETPWLGAAVWAVLFLSDYFLTLLGARLYVANGSRYFAFEGSYELTPAFQNDVDRQKKFSRRFWIAFLAGVIILNGYWYLAVEAGRVPGLYLIVAGALILVQIAVHTRHLRNIATFRLQGIPGLAAGRISYSRYLVMQLSAYDALLYALLYAVVTFITLDRFIAGGVIGCLILATRHFFRARKIGKTPLPDAVAA
jgi:hypothetical protein